MGLIKVVIKRHHTEQVKHLHTSHFHRLMVFIIALLQTNVFK